MADYKVVLIILYDAQNRLLLQHRTQDAKVLPGYWAFFGGGVKQGESLAEALQRESYEELNYTVENPRLIFEQDFQENNVSGHLYVYIDALRTDKSRLQLNEGQGWGWYKEIETAQLKMVERDRQIIKQIIEYLKNETVSA